MSMTKKHSFKYEELIDCANGKLFGPGNAKLPLPPMLMFDRITNIQDTKGKFGKGSFAFPGPNNFPLAQSINSSYLKLCFFVILKN